MKLNSTIYIVQALDSIRLYSPDIQGKANAERKRLYLQ